MLCVFFFGINSAPNSYDSAEPCDRHQECSGISLNDLTNQVFFSLLPISTRPAFASQTWPPVAARALASKTSDPPGPPAAEDTAGDGGKNGENAGSVGESVSVTLPSICKIV